MINIFDCASIESYLCEILRYSLDVEKVSIDTYAKVSLADRPNDIWLATILVSKQEHQIEIVCSTEADAQFGYKFANTAIASLHSKGFTNITSYDFIRLKATYNTLLKRLPLVCDLRSLNLFFTDENYRMAILYGLIVEIKEFKTIEFILPILN
ncbi:hypothetical protein [Chamaesiphon polymorphus]|uniref:hypothetical protein n=1 Tax=Chamaesiphon polymorphus TaxID=2107691 RepID=UPI0011B25437|nr:hypothetical protein [Chamaesiphon polymorphus]